MTNLKSRHKLYNKTVVYDKNEVSGKLRLCESLNYDIISQEHILDINETWKSCNYDKDNVSAQMRLGNPVTMTKTKSQLK